MEPSWSSLGRSAKDTSERLPPPDCVRRGVHTWSTDALEDLFKCVRYGRRGSSRPREAKWPYLVGRADARRHFRNSIGVGMTQRVHSPGGLRSSTARPHTASARKIQLCMAPVETDGPVHLIPVTNSEMRGWVTAHGNSVLGSHWFLEPLQGADRERIATPGLRYACLPATFCRPSGAWERDRRLPNCHE